MYSGHYPAIQIICYCFRFQFQSPCVCVFYSQIVCSRVCDFNFILKVKLFTSGRIFSDLHKHHQNLLLRRQLSGWSDKIRDAHLKRPPQSELLTLIPRTLRTGCAIQIKF